MYLRQKVEVLLDEGHVREGRESGVQELVLRFSHIVGQVSRQEEGQADSAGSVPLRQIVYGVGKVGKIWLK